MTASSLNNMTKFGMVASIIVIMLATTAVLCTGIGTNAEDTANSYSGTVSELWPEEEIVFVELNGPVSIRITPDSAEGYDYEVYKTLNNRVETPIINGGIETTVAETGYSNIILKRTDTDGQIETRTIVLLITTVSEDGKPIYGASQEPEISISPESNTVRVGQSYEVSLSINPSDFNQYLRWVRWTMQTGGIATISNSGTFGTSMSETVTATAKGTDNVMAYTSFAEPDSSQADGYVRYSAWAYSKVTVFEGFIINWMSQDGTTVLETTEVKEGVKPTYSGTAPTKSQTAQYSYTFAGWAETVNQESGVSASALPVATKDTSYYAAFSKATRTYAVTINAGDHGAVSKAKEIVPYGTTLAVNGNYLSIGTKTVQALPDEGYRLSSWSDTPLTVTEPVTVTAYFEIKTYTITFAKEGNGSNFNSSIKEVPHGTKITVLSANSILINGKQYDVHPDEGYVCEWTIPSNTVTSDMTITSKFVAKTYTISFNTNGGTAKSPAIATYGSSYGAAEGWPSDPTKDGCVFGGWYKDQALTKLVEPNDVCKDTSDITLYAKWDAETTSYVNNLYFRGVTDGVTGWPDDMYANATSLSPTSKFTIPAEPVKSGYKFMGWEYQGAKYRAGNTIEVSYGNSKTLTAVWEVSSYTFVNKVVFVGKTSDTTDWPEEMSQSATNISPTSKFTIPSVAPKRTGFILECWMDGETPYMPGDQISVRGNTTSGSTVTLEAKWVEKAEITSNPVADAKITRGSSVNEFNFDASGSKNASSVLWNFGDGETSDKVQVTHTYKSPGTYNVVLKVTNADGKVSTFEESVTVPETSEQGIKEILIDNLGFILMAAIIVAIMFALIRRIV